ncbi:MAG: EF-hand domain-containing protein [Ruegeria sp.]
MKNTTFISAILLTAIAVTGTSALAMGPRGGESVTFQELDADGNGEVSKAELEEHRNNRTAGADANGDGKISLEEMQAAAQKQAADRVAKMFERHDANKDGFISDDELPKPRNAGKMFDRIDADGNGAISEQEFTDAREKMGRHHKKRGQPKSDSN